MSKEVIGDFISGNKKMIIVRLEHGTHVMPYEEWKSVYGRLHPDRWNYGRKRKRHRFFSMVRKDIE